MKIQLTRLFSLLFFAALMLCTTTAEAQYGKKKKRRPTTETEQKDDKKSDNKDEDQGIRIKRDDDYTFSDGEVRPSSNFDWREKLWFGSGFQLGFAGNSNQSAFNVGVSPMVGYKITNFWSAGPRFSYDYLNQRFDLGSRIERFNIHSFGLGAFTRLQFLQQFLIHAEYERYFTKEIRSNLTTERININRLNVGGGLYQSTPQGFGFAQYLVIGIIEERDDNREDVNIPIQFRFEINYNF